MAFSSRDSIMNSVKIVAITTAFWLLVLFATVREFSSHSNTGACQTRNYQLKGDAFSFGISRAVAAYQIEKFIAKGQMPPMDLHLNQHDAIRMEAQKRILIVSTWRSGSAFLGELIGSYPGVFYSYEPLFVSKIYQGSKSQLIKSLFQCHYPDDYLRQVSGETNGGELFMGKNVRAWAACQHDKSLCYNPAFVAEMCSIFPIHLMKEVRLRVNELEKLFRNVNNTPIDWKVVYLVRDPRGVMASRMNLTWCQHQADECLNSERLCFEVDDDLTRMEQLKSRYPNQFAVIKFEELTANVETETEKLFQFLALPVARSVQTFLETHTDTDRGNGNPYSTYRRTRQVASQWKTKLPNDVVTRITDVCRPLLKRLNFL